jgi:hypothetical protein
MDIDCPAIDSTIQDHHNCCSLKRDYLAKGGTTHSLNLLAELARVTLLMYTSGAASKMQSLDLKSVNIVQ